MGVAYREKSIYEQDKILSSQYIRDAIDAYSNAAKILPKDYDTIYNLALAFHLNGDYPDAGGIPEIHSEIRAFCKYGQPAAVLLFFWG